MDPLTRPVDDLPDVASVGRCSADLEVSNDWTAMLGSTSHKSLVGQLAGPFAGLGESCTHAQHGRRDTPDEEEEWARELAHS